MVTLPGLLVGLLVKSRYFTGNSIAVVCLPEIFGLPPYVHDDAIGLPEIFGLNLHMKMPHWLA